MVRFFPDYRSLSSVAADLVVGAGKGAFSKRGRFDLVLSGGNSPRLAYEIIAERYGDEDDLWSATHVWWGDERCVPPDDEASNYRMASESLLSKVAVADENVHRIPADEADPGAAAARYAAEFPESVDALLLGLGRDGHTASIFPGSNAESEFWAPFVAVEGPPSTTQPKRRITITPAGLMRAPDLIFLVSGEGKSGAFRSVFFSEAAPFLTARMARGSTWLVDRNSVAEFLASL